MAQRPYSTSFFDVMPTASRGVDVQSGKRWASFIAVALLVLITLNHALGMSFAPIGLQGGQGRFCSPVKASISSNYGFRMHPISHVRRKHDGIDFSVPYGQPVRAFTDGRVNYSGWMGGYGQAIQVSHGPIDHVQTSTRYAHLSRRSVAPGQWVKKGQILGYSGSSGLSTGPHLHFEVIKNGVVTNPNPYLKQVVATSQPNTLMMLTHAATVPLTPVGASGPWFGRMVNFIDGPVAAPVPIEWRGLVFIAMLILLGVQCVRWELKNKQQQNQAFETWQTLRAETNKTPLSQVLSQVSQSLPNSAFVPASSFQAASQGPAPTTRVKWTLPQAQNPVNNPFMTRSSFGA